MAKTYLQLIPIPGKWYVSERFQTSGTKWDIIDPTQTRPKRSPSDMILAGPFETRNLAMTWNSQTNTSGYIWEKEASKPEPAAEE